MAHWDRVKQAMEQYGAVIVWNDTGIGIHDNIAGLKVNTREGNQISVISHKYSYGGDRGLFEIMPGVDYPTDVDGFLSEDEVIRKIHILGPYY